MDKEIEEFYEIYQEVIELEIEEGWDESEFAFNIYNDEMNWKNGDKSSGMYCLDEMEIVCILSTIYNELKTYEDRCSDCGRILKEDEYIYVREKRPDFWGGACSETITTGYMCRCGFEERF